MLRRSRARRASGLACRGAGTATRTGSVPIPSAWCTPRRSTAGEHSASPQPAGTSRGFTTPVDKDPIKAFNDIRNLCFDAAPQNSNVHVIRDRVAAANLVAASLYIDYIYLDTDERRKFAQVSHEYLIDVLQFTGGESITSSSNKLKLNFNHPCKELIWVVQRDSFVSCEDAIIFPWKGQQRGHDLTALAGFRSGVVNATLSKLAVITP